MDDRPILAWLIMGAIILFIAFDLRAQSVERQDRQQQVTESIDSGDSKDDSPGEDANTYPIHPDSADIAYNQYLDDMRQHDEQMLREVDRELYGRCNIKGNISYDTGEKIYHMPYQKWYDDTEIDANYGERWFCTEEEATNAGWRKAYE